MKKYIVTYVEYENGRASNPFAFHQTFNTKEEARQAIVDDIEEVVTSRYIGQVCKTKRDRDGTLSVTIYDRIGVAKIVYNIQSVEV